MLFIVGIMGILYYNGIININTSNAQTATQQTAAALNAIWQPTSNPYTVHVYDPNDSSTAQVSNKQLLGSNTDTQDLSSITDTQNIQQQPSSDTMTADEIKQLISDAVQGAIMAVNQNQPPVDNTQVVDNAQADNTVEQTQGQETDSPTLTPIPQPDPWKTPEQIAQETVLVKPEDAVPGDIMIAADGHAYTLLKDGLVLPFGSTTVDMLMSLTDRPDLAVFIWPGHDKAQPGDIYVLDGEIYTLLDGGMSLLYKDLYASKVVPMSNTDNASALIRMRAGKIPLDSSGVSSAKAILRLRPDVEIKNKLTLVPTSAPTQAPAPTPIVINSEDNQPVEPAQNEETSAPVQEKKQEPKSKEKSGDVRVSTNTPKPTAKPKQATPTPTPTPAVFVNSQKLIVKSEGSIQIKKSQSTQSPQTYLDPQAFAEGSISNNVKNAISDTMSGVMK